jgi:hypothetical protein
LNLAELDFSTCRRSIYNHGMATEPKTKLKVRSKAKPKARPKGRWTSEEIARNERVNKIRVERDREKTPAERLEETVRVSRFISELRQGVPDDVRAR